MPETLHALWRDGRARTGLTVLGLVGLLAVAAPWVTSFDPVAQTWATVNKGFWSGAGLAEGKDNLMWISSHLGISSVDIDTFELGPTFMTDETVKGVGVDLKGNIWGVTYQGEDDMGNPVGKAMVMKVDHETMALLGTYEGLDHPYTYSDFTGNALFNVTCLPPG